MRPFEFPGLPRSRTLQAAMATGVYCLLTAWVLYAPIAEDAPFVRLFGSQALARQAMTFFVQCLFWPLLAILTVTALRGCYEFARSKRAGN
jgi:hypothetical protein